MTTQELETVASYVKDHLSDWLEQPPTTVPSDYFRLGERLLRVEEAIKNQSLLMEKRFEAMDKRFEDMNRRFEDLIHQIDKRFEDMNRRFEDLTHQMDKRFESMERRFESMDKRFESMEKRFEDLTHQMDKRFEQISKQVANSFGWAIGIMSGSFVALGVLITVYRFLGAGG